MKPRHHFAMAFLAVAVAAGPAAAGSFDAESIVGDTDLSSFESVYIAPVTANLDLDVAAFPRNGGDRPVDASDVAEKAADFHDELTEAFSRSFSLADAPGPGILTIEVTLTDLEASRPTMADYRRAPGLSFASVYAGGGEMTAVLSENGVTIAEVSDRFTSYLSDERARAGVWSDADRAFDRWARNLVEFVEEN